MHNALRKFATSLDCDGLDKVYKSSSHLEILYQQEIQSVSDFVKFLVNLFRTDWSETSYFIDLVVTFNLKINGFRQLRMQQIDFLFLFFS